MIMSGLYKIQFVFRNARTISCPIQVHGVTKVPAKRAQDLGEHNEEILKELGFDAKEIDGFRAIGTLGKPKEPAKRT